MGSIVGAGQASVSNGDSESKIEQGLFIFTGNYADNTSKIGIQPTLKMEETLVPLRPRSVPARPALCRLLGSVLRPLHPRKM